MKLSSFWSMSNRMEIEKEDAVDQKVIEMRRSWYGVRHENLTYTFVNTPRRKLLIKMDTLHRFQVHRPISLRDTVKWKGRERSHSQSAHGPLFSRPKRGASVGTYIFFTLPPRNHVHSLGQLESRLKVLFANVSYVFGFSFKGFNVEISLLSL